MIQVSADGSMQQLHRSGLQLQLDSAEDVERHIQARTHPPWWGPDFLPTGSAYLCNGRSLQEVKRLLDQGLKVSMILCAYYSGTWNLRIACVPFGFS